MKRFLPGRIDGLLLGLVLACVCSLILPWSKFLDGVDPSWFQVAVFMACGSATGAFVGLVNLWLLLSDRHLVQRHAISLALTVPVALCVAMSTEWIRIREPEFTFSTIDHGILASYYVLFGIYRWVSVCFLTLLSLPLQAVTRWRISDGKSSEKQRTSITHILILMASFAIAIGVLRPFFHFMDDWTSIRGLVILTIVEITILMVFMLLPTLCCLWNRWSRKHYLKSLVTIGAIVGVPSLLGTITLLAGEGPNWKGVSRIYLNYAVFMGCLAIGVTFAKVSGFRFEHLIRSELNEASDLAASPKPSFRWTGVLASIGLLGITLFLQYQYDPMPLVSYGENLSDDLALSNRIRSISRVLGTPRSSTYSYEWRANKQTQEYSEDNISYDDLFFRGFKQPSQVLKPLLNGEADAQGIYIQSSRPYGVDCFELLGQLDSVGFFTLDCDRVDAKSLGEFLAGTEIDTLNLDCEMSDDHIAALAAGRFSSVEIHNTTQVDSETILTLREIPIGAMSISFENNTDISLDGFDVLFELTVSDSNLTDGFFDGLERCPKLQRLSLKQCDLDGAVISRLQRLKIEWLVIKVGADHQCDPEELLKIADNQNILSVDLEADDIEKFGPSFESRFDMRHGQKVLNFTKDEVAVDDRLGANGDFLAIEDPNQAVPMLTWAVARCGSFDMAIDKIAQDVQRNDDGEIVELNLQWISMSEKDAKQIAELDTLKRLRFGAWNSELVEETIFSSSSIESLEIPCPPLRKESLLALSKMQQLRRLQLPLFDLEYSVNQIARPEQIPFPVRFAELSWQELEDNRINMIGEESGIEAFPKIKTLTSLEYLFIPGYLLDNSTIKTIASFPQLRELHAPFSGCDGALLKRLSQVKQLRSLTVGIDPTIFQDRRKLAEQFVTASQHLRMLQLFVFDNELFASKEKQTEWEEHLQDMMGQDSELHLIVLPVD